MAALLFRPLPPCRADTSVSESSHVSYFGDNAATGKSLSLQTKSGISDCEVFRQYLCLFPTTRVPFRSSWSHPFNPDRLTQSNRPEVEVAATMYNFIAFLQAKILTMDSRTQSSLVAIRGLLPDSLIALRTLINYSRRSDHPGFSLDVATFVTSYHRFVIAVWQFSCGRAASCSDHDMARYLHLVLIELGAAQTALRSVHHPPAFALLVNGTIDYYTALARFHLGKKHEMKNELGVALTSYRSTIADSLSAF
jgi:hypothetical protein